LGTTLEDISISGTDTSANTATNVNPTNEATKAAYTDTVSPSVILSTPENPTNDPSFTVTAQFSEPVTGVANGDFVVVGGTKSNFTSVDADTYTIVVTPTTNSISINMAASTSSDLAGNSNTAATQLIVSADNTAPTVTVSSLVNPTNTDPIPMTATFSEPVTGFAEDDITITGGTVTATSLTTLDNIAYTFTIAPSGNGTILVDIAGDAATDGVNGNTAAIQFSINYDNIAPSVILSTPENPTNHPSFTVTAQFSESVTGVSIDDFAVSGGTKSNFVALDADTYTIDVIPTTGSITLDMASNTSYDLAGNGTTAATQLVVTFDNTAPTVTLSTSINPTPRPTFIITAKFSEPVTGVSIDDFVVTDGTKSNFVALNADTYSIKVTKTATSVTIDMASSSASDLTGNGNTEASQLIVIFDPTTSTPGICSPTSGNWSITSSCTIIDDVAISGNVEVQNNSVLTVENGASLNIDFANHYLKVHSGSGVLIKSGGKIN